MFNKIAIVSGLLAVSSSAFAWNHVNPRPEDATSRGDCQDVEVVFNQDKSQLEYDFYDYEAYTDVNQCVSRSRAICKVKVPVEVPAGYQVAVSTAILEYAGYVAGGGQGHTSIRYRIAGHSSEGITKTFPQGELSDGDSRIIYTPNNPRYSGCGEDVELELVSTVTVRAPLDGGEDSDVSFESGFSNFKSQHFGRSHFDFAHKLLYKKCW